MIRNLRVQLLASHLALVALMVVMMAGAVASFLHLGRSIDHILRDNYKSVAAAQNMKEALERIDSANAFHLAGQDRLARRQYEEYRPRFEAAYHAEAANITEAGEQDIANDIGRRLWPRYRRDTERLLYGPPVPLPQARAFYFGTVQPEFAHLKQRAQDVLDVNQRAIWRADARARAEARRASRVGVGMTAGALALAMFLALRMIGSSLTPLRTLARQAEEIGAGHLNQRIELHRNDEIGALAASFNRMAESLNEARRAEAQRLHRAERMSDEALDSLYDPVVVIDGAGHVVHLNHAAEGLFGPAGRAAGRPVAQVVDAPRVAQAAERAVRQERVSAEEGEGAFVTLTAGEAERTYRLRVTPMRDGDGSLLGAVAVLEDVTHLRHLDRLKTEFISVASHELRTPVTSLLLSVQLLEEGAAGSLTTHQREIVAAQRNDLERLQRMMGDLLDLTRLEAGVEPPRFEILAPRDLAEAAAASVRPQAEAQGVDLAVDEAEGAPPVRADRGQMVRALVNLLSNAVRHTPRGGKVTLRACARDGAALFQVADTGSGIPKEYLSRIFERFVQVPGATRGGAGLGLSIARTIARAHGGDIEVESEPAHGSVFTLRLPAAASPDRKE